ncbi:Calcium-dependent protease precursor [Anatilimnocola aggregata]|uniref:Calcium-dependent protease n=1 Tax=Anatilimnocola aggregata TaxID=2528021 RepID=A0A517YMA1_9BACT|nr:M36 family metallopeptidase [Anatilimnocola aggregata]QDU31357.1 Calcium-dependent protease precursor [Anatilimnocola aggregata]
MANRSANRIRRSHAVKRRRLLAEKLEPRMMLHGGDESLDTFYLPPQHRLGGDATFLSGPKQGAPLQIAVDFLKEHAADLGLNAADLESSLVSDQYTDEHSGVTHIYLQQIFNGLEVMSADLSIHVSDRGEVIHATSSFVGDVRVVEDLRPRFVISAPQAFLAWNDDFGLSSLTVPQVTSVTSDVSAAAVTLSVKDQMLDDVAAKLVYVPTAKGLELAWRLDVHSRDYTSWFDAFVDAETGESLYTDDRIGHATYNVYSRPVQSPYDGSRSVLTDPHDTLASPFGWHDTNGAAGSEFTDTRGNNVLAQEDLNADNTGGSRPSGGASLGFNFPFEASQDPANYQSAAITNAFYWINLLHDIHYQYGFTEAAGNFQVNNYGRGGLGNDPVIVDIQDGDGGGDGFAALPDGQSPRMTLHRRSNPFRDSAFDTDILVHEYGHGISERLTGGPANVSALNAKQSRAMGEGWGDWWALMFTQVATDAKFDAYPIGNYAAGYPSNGPGIRPYPYSFDMTINPLTYNSYNSYSAVQSHYAGAIWAATLWDMNWQLIQKHGFSADLLHGNAGNNLALQLVMDGLKVQGTNPSFLAGRDAILAADLALTGGQNQTEIWAAFARRGMGFSASDGGSASATTVAEAFDVPGSISGTVFRDDDASGTQSGNEPGLANWAVYLDKNNNGIADVATTLTFNSTDTPKTIPDGPKTLSTQTVSGLSGVITDINVSVDITHPRDGELYITLISPGNTPIILANYLGGSGANYTKTTFDDEAATYISSATAPFTGSFRPFFDLRQLEGRDPNGTWTLRLDDAVGGNTGTLQSWSLQIAYGNTDPTVVTDTNGNYVFLGVGNGTHHVREVMQPGFARTSPASGLHDAIITGGQPVIGQNFGNRAAALVANVSTEEDTLSPPVTISPAIGQGITHYKISDITSGSLYKSDGITAINNGELISVAEGQSGVRFLPSANSNDAGRFTVELSQDGSTLAAGTSPTIAMVSVTPVGDTPQITSLSTLEDKLSGAIVINRHAADGMEVTHFKITGITGGTLYKSDGVTVIANGTFITVAEGQAGVRFLPSMNINAVGAFHAESSQNGTTVAAQSNLAAGTIAVTAVNDAPIIALLTDSPDLVTQGLQLTLTVHGVSDPDGVDEVLALEFYRDINGDGAVGEGDLFLGGDTISSDGWSWSGSTASFYLGDHRYLARAWDGELWSPAATATGTVQPQIVPVVGSLSASPTIVTRPAAITLTANGVSASGGYGVTAVEFYRDLNANGSLELGTDQLLGIDASGADGWVWTGSTAGFDVGVNRYFARAQSLPAIWGNPATKTSTIKNALPSIASLSDSPDPVILGGTMTLTANTVADTDGNVVLVEFYRDLDNDNVIDPTDEFLGSDDSVTDGWKWTGSTVSFPVGSVKYLSRARDNNNAWSATRYTTGLVNLPPALASISVSSNLLHKGDSLTITASGVSDAAPGTVTAVEFYRDANSNGVIDAGDVSLGSDTTAADGWFKVLSTSAFPLGTVQVIARAKDNNSAYSPIVSQSLWVNSKPTIGSLTASPTSVVQGANVTLTANTVADTDGYVVLVEFYRDLDNDNVIDPTDEFLGSDDSVTDGWKWTGSTVSFPVGSVKYLSRARDNNNAWSATRYTTGLVNLPPALASISVSSNLLHKGDSLTITASGVSDAAPGTVTAVEFYRDANSNGVIDAGDVSLGSDTTAADGWFKVLSTSAFPLGTVQVIARAKDNNSAYSPIVSQSLWVNSKPTIGSLTASPTSVVQGANVTLTANTVADTDGSVVAVEMYLDLNGNNVIDSETDVFLGNATSTALGNWKLVSSTVGLPIGTVRYLARAKDQLGSWSPTKVLTLTVIAP